MKTLLVGLLVGGVCGFALQKYVLEDEVASSRSRRGDVPVRGDDDRPERAEEDDGVNVDLLLAKIRDLEARLASMKGEEEVSTYGEIEVPLTEEGIETLLESFERTGDLDQLLALIKALLLQGEKGYPRLTRVLYKMIGMGMANRFSEEDLLQRIVPAARMAMSHEKALVGYVGYLMTNDNVPSMMRTGSMAAAMFLSVNGVRGSEAFAPKLLEAFLARSEGDDDQRRMLLEAMGMLKQKEAVDPLLAILNDPQKGNDHRRAVEALGRIGDPRAVTSIVQRLQSPPEGRNSWWHGRTEIEALARIGSPEALAAATTHLTNLTNNQSFYNQASAYLRVQKDDKVVTMIRDRFRANTE